MGKLKIIGFVVILPLLVCAKTWRVGEDLALEALTSQVVSFEQDFALITSAVDKGQIEEAKLAIWDFQRKYPEQTADKDWQAYVEAELTFAENNWKRSSELFVKFLDDYPVSDFYNAALERCYEIASAFLSGQKRRAFKIFLIRAYDDGEVIMRKIADKSGNTQIAQRALITLARSLEDRGKYFDAYDVWVQVAMRAPTGEGGRLSLSGMARTMHSAYNGESFDASPVLSAEGYYGQYMLRYPEIAQEQQVQEYIDTAREQIAYKNYSTGRYYEENFNYQSALIYYNHVVNDYSDTKIATLAERRIPKVSRLQGIKRVKPEDKSLLWRLGHFFDFNAMQEE